MKRTNHTNSMLTASELAHLLNIHINTVRRWSNQGILKVHRIGPRGDRRFKKEDIAVFLAEFSQDNGNHAELRPNSLTHR